jgi:hypothetical protein
MPNFKDIGNEIIKKINEKRGLFLGVGHKDKHFNKYLAEFLQEIKKEDIIIFAEIKESAFSSYLPGFEMVKEQEGNINFDRICELLEQMPNMGSTASIEFFAFLLISRLSNIKVIPFNDIVMSKAQAEQNELAHKILNNMIANVTKEMLSWASGQRVSIDGMMAAKIRESLSTMPQNQKYVVIGGPAHIQISKALQIDALNVMSFDLYKNMLLSSHESVVQSLCSEGVTSFAHKENSIKEVYWKLDELNQSGIYSNPHIGSPITASGDAHNSLYNSVQKTFGTLEQDDPKLGLLKLYSSFFTAKQYGRALRHACNASGVRDEFTLKLIKAILTFKDTLININEKTEDDKTAIYYAALNGNQEVYDLLVANGANVGNEKNILEESLRKLGEKKSTVSPQTK